MEDFYLLHSYPTWDNYTMCYKENLTLSFICSHSEVELQWWQGRTICLNLHYHCWQLLLNAAVKCGASGSKISGVEVWEMEVEGQQKQMIRSEISGQTQEEARFELGGRVREDISQRRLVQQSDCQEEELLFSCFFFLWQNQRHNWNKWDEIPIIKDLLPAAMTEIRMKEIDIGPNSGQVWDFVEYKAKW